MICHIFGTGGAGTAATDDVSGAGVAEVAAGVAGAAATDGVSGAGVAEVAAGVAGAAATADAVVADAAGACAAPEGPGTGGPRRPRARRLPRWAGELVRLVLLLVATSMVTFALVGLSPIDPVQMNLGQASYARMDAAQRAQLASYWGTDLPIWQRYLNWAGSALAGDLGQSLRYNAPVAQVVGERAANSLVLMLVAWLLSGALGLGLGVLAGARRGRLADRLVRGWCYLLSSTPTFWLGLVALMVFAVWLRWFPLGFSVPIGVDAAQVSWADKAYHLVLPALVLSVTGVANIALHTREKVIDVLESDYVRFALARGESTGEVLRRHGLRNLVIPAITLECAQVSEVFGGSVLVEQVFSYPGLGQAAVTAGLGGDASLLVAIALVSALIVFGGNAVANVLYGVIDPRMREGEVRHVA